MRSMRAADAVPRLAGIRPAPPWVRWFLRVGSVLVALEVLLQAVTAGGFVSGDIGFLDVHAVNSDIVSTVWSLQFFGALGLWWRGRGPHWPIWASLIELGLIETQKILGMLRLVEYHIPLGVLIFGVATAFMAWAFSDRLEVRERPGRAHGHGTENGGTV